VKVLDKRVFEAMIGVVDRHFQVAPLNDFLKRCIDEKMKETSLWSEITLCTHFMLGGNSSFIYRIGAFTELIILALDIIDDLVDRDSANKSWMKLPQSIVLNASIALLVAAIGEISILKEQNTEQCLPLSGEINQLLTYAANGQHRDISNSLIETEEEYISIILNKSAPLKILACYMGYACIDHLSKTTIEQINEMARNLAIVAQIQNDINDLILFDVKNDLLDKKRTIPIMYLLSQNSSKHSIIKDYYEGSISSEQFLSKKKECVQYIRKSGCVEYSKIIQGLYLNKVEMIINSIHCDLTWKERFNGLAIAPYRI
jgi:competence protein ComQ